MMRRIGIPPPEELWVCLTVDALAQTNAKRLVNDEGGPRSMARHLQGQTTRLTRSAAGQAANLSIARDSAQSQFERGKNSVSISAKTLGAAIQISEHQSHPWRYGGFEISEAGLPEFPHGGNRLVAFQQHTRSQGMGRGIITAGAQRTIQSHVGRIEVILQQQRGCHAGVPFRIRGCLLHQRFKLRLSLSRLIGRQPALSGDNVQLSLLLRRSDRRAELLLGPLSDIGKCTACLIGLALQRQVRSPAQNHHATAR